MNLTIIIFNFIRIYSEQNLNLESYWSKHVQNTQFKLTIKSNIKSTKRILYYKPWSSLSSCGWFLLLKIKIEHIFLHELAWNSPAGRFIATIMHVCSKGFYPTRKPVAKLASAYQSILLQDKPWQAYRYIHYYYFICKYYNICKIYSTFAR